MTAVLVTLAFLPVYLLLRWPYRRLPLHIDTGYYVSNHTVVTGRFDYSRGWNARYAGCSKVLPEWFHSRVYLACRRHDDPGAAYRVRSRVAASLLNYVTAVLVGVLAWRLSGSVGAYYAGLGVFALLSSEPQWGVYFECAELFELPFHVLAVICLVEGIAQQSYGWVGLAAFVWATEAFFVKLSSAAGFAMLFGAAIALWPRGWFVVLVGGAAATAMYIAWLRHNGRTVRGLFAPLHGHEASFGQGASFNSLLHRLGEKLRRVGMTVRRQPIIPLLAVISIASVDRPPTILLAYFAAVLIAHAVQATDCWYYQIPLLPPIAVLAAGLASSNTGTVALVAASLVWLVHNTWRDYRLDAEKLSDWCWDAALPRDTTRRNILLERSTEELRAIVSDHSLLVYGPFNQAYVLFGTSYDTPIVSPDHHLDVMDPTWQWELNLRLAAEPPQFVLDTGDCFDAHATRTGLGLDYRVDRTLDGGFRLFRFERRGPAGASPADVRTYAPHGSSNSAASSGDATPARLSALLDEVSARGHKHLAIYGAGRFTVRNAAAYRASPVPIVAVLDDQRGGRGESLLGWPILDPEAAERLGVDAVVISTDRFQSLMLRRARRLWGERVAVYYDTSACPA